MLHLDEGELVEYKGTYSQYREARAADEERLAKLADRQQAEIKRLSTLADSMRHQTAKRARVAKTLDKRVERLQAAAVDRSGPNATAATRCSSPSRPTPAGWCSRPTSLAKAYGGPPVFEDVSFAVERGERLLVMGLNGAGKTSLLRILAGWSEPVRRGLAHRGRRVPGYYAQEHEGIHAGVTVLDHMREASDAAETRAARACSGCSGWSARSPSRTPAPCPAARRPSWRWPSWSPGGTTCCCSTSRPTTSIRRRGRPSAGPLADWPGAMILVSHDVGFVTELAPDRVLLMPDGDRGPLERRPARPGGHGLGA